jgi:HEPN superfamily RiboL-PSP-like protein
VASDVGGELAAIHEEFLEELTGIREFSSPVDEAGLRLLSGRARVAAANGAILLLAALYEENIRQMVRAVFNFRRTTSQGQLGFPDKLPSIIWRRSLEILARKPFDDLVRDGSQTDLQLKEIVSFCIRGNLGSDVSSAISHNENNMRPEELGRLFNQVGIQSVILKIGDSSVIKSFYGTDNAGRAAEKARSSMEDFFRRRNEIAHAIQIGASGGPASLSNDIAFFETVSSALVDLLTRELHATGSSG